ncbi:polysaccharide deacetylase [Brevibacillus brevis]|uniref:Polysaccharide deacetylase n=1 Tax=Brevibacillus brevis TaxID=1393 RepID=A0ABY9SYM7_BREBE|nr:polysaccharide deacetylase [Brevibacillus brevis]WNC12938.1 polysaccharide deacetylase [Brevibacillus brevis]
MSEPRLQWPNGARCAVMLSFDMDAETIWANGNKHIEGGSQFIRSLSIGQYGPLRSVPRILELLRKYDLPATFFVPAWVAETYPEPFVAIAKEGHELGHHGYLHERFVDLSSEEQLDIIQRSQDIFKRMVGKEARGFRTPSGDWAKQTPQLLHDAGFLYSSSMRGDDRPYRTVLNGEESDFIEIPPRWELDDYVQFGYNLYPAEPAGQDRISSHEYVLDNFKQEFDGYYRYGLCYVLMMHPQIIGKPGRILMLEQLIQHIKSHPDVWFATGEQIAEWWREKY